MLKKFIPVLASAALFLTVVITGYLLTQTLLGEPAHTSGTQYERLPVAPSDLYAGKNPHGARSLGSLSAAEKQELNSAEQALDLALTDFLSKEEELGLLSQVVNQHIRVKIKELLDLQVLTGETPGVQNYTPGSTNP